MFSSLEYIKEMVFKSQNNKEEVLKTLSHTMQYLLHIQQTLHQKYPDANVGHHIVYFLYHPNKN